MTAVAILADLDKGLWRGLQLVRMRELAKAPTAALGSDLAPLPNFARLTMVAAAIDVIERAA